MSSRTIEVIELARPIAIAHAPDESSNVAARWLLLDHAARTGTESDQAIAARDLASALTAEARARIEMASEACASDAAALLREAIELLEVAHRAHTCIAAEH